MVQRMTGPSAISATLLSKDVGVPQPTLSAWLREASTLPTMSSKKKSGGEVPKSPRQWSATEKLEVVLAAGAVPESELGAFLRSKGLRESDLAAWREIVRTSATEALDGAKKKPPTSNSKSTADARKIKWLEGKLAEKDKRLHAMNTLLDIQKKVREIWGDADEPTPGKSAT